MYLWEDPMGDEEVVGEGGEELVCKKGTKEEGKKD